MYPSPSVNMALMKLRRWWYTPKKEVPKDVLPMSPEGISKVLAVI